MGEDYSPSTLLCHARLQAGIHVPFQRNKQNVDGRDKPGHDEV